MEPVTGYVVKLDIDNDIQPLTYELRNFFYPVSNGGMLDLDRKNNYPKLFDFFGYLLYNT